MVTLSVSIAFVSALICFLLFVDAQVVLRGEYLILFGPDLTVPILGIDLELCSVPVVEFAVVWYLSRHDLTPLKGIL
jgi:hypothetical protein